MARAEWPGGLADDRGTAFYSAGVADFVAADPAAIIDRLVVEQVRHFRVTEAAAIGAWESTIALLRAALATAPVADGWRILLEFPLLRLGRRIDTVLIAPEMVLVLEFKIGASGFVAADLEQVEDYALDLRDFHSASRAVPIVPILVATEAAAPQEDWPLPMAGVAPPMRANGESLGPLIAALAVHYRPLPAAIETSAWERAPYRPVPGIIEAARLLYAGHGVAEITAARAGSAELERTTKAVLDAVASAETERRHLVLFVTGVPGAGKTLVGLNVVFGTGRRLGAAYLTGNPTLVLVLREALARDAARHGTGRLRQARQEVEGKIQRLPWFRDHYVARPDEVPAERAVVIDEAQRCWSRDWAIRKTRDRESRLSQPEPAHLLDIMARQQDWAVLVCLVGGGQEIHDGEGGLAEWGLALEARPLWAVRAAEAVLHAGDPRQRLPLLSGLRITEGLDLVVPARAIRNAAAPEWVDAVLANDPGRARAIVQSEGSVPFRLTRDLGAMRQALRRLSEGGCRAGLVASSGARRLRAEGIGAELPHMDADAVTHWFLDRWPDVRASAALEVPATEFSCQGLELDYAGVCWGGDLVRRAGVWPAAGWPAGGWKVREFRGSAWTVPRDPERIANTTNTYRVLLTRARHETILWVPRGDAADETRPPADYAAVVEFLLDCGVRPLDDGEPPGAATTIPHRWPQLALVP
ncbi:MAG: DUF2075 domain-containing protein [Acetobacteraceae bacterium]